MKKSKLIMLALCAAMGLSVASGAVAKADDGKVLNSPTSVVSPSGETASVPTGNNVKSNNFGASAEGVEAGQIGASTDNGLPGRPVQQNNGDRPTTTS